MSTCPCVTGIGVLGLPKTNQEETPEKFPNFINLTLEHIGGSREERDVL